MKPEQLDRPSHGTNRPRFHYNTNNQIAPTMASLEVKRSLKIPLQIIVYILVLGGKAAM